MLVTKSFATEWQNDEAYEHKKQEFESKMTLVYSNHTPNKLQHQLTICIVLHTISSAFVFKVIIVQG